MNIKVVEYSIFVLSVTVLYLIVVCRDLRRTNNLQDVALDELTKSLPLLVKTNIDSYHNNIKTENEILKNESIDKKNEDLHQDTMKGDLAHHDDETKREKYTNVNGGVSRKVSHRNYDKHRYGRDVPTIPTHEYRKSFDAANRMRNKKKKTIKKIWAKQNLFSNKSSEEMKIQESVKDNNWKSLNKKQKQRQGLQEMSRRKIGGRKNRSGGYPFRKLELHQPNSSHTTHESSIRETESHEAHNNMTTKCFLLDEGTVNPFNQGEDETMFKLSLDLMTDIAPWDTSWALFSSHDRNGIIINSMAENSTTSDSLLPHTLHRFEYECYVTDEDTNQIKALESNKEICYDFYIYEYLGMCCVYGLGYFKLSINEEIAISERFYGHILTTPFCLDNNGKLLSKEEEENPNSIYPPYACQNAGRCICDSNPTLTSFEEEDNDEMYQLKMNVMVRMIALSGSDKLMDVSTPQYKAACWTLNDDSFFVKQLESTSMSTKRLEQRMIQRYILALFYFATNGQYWFYHFNFLSSLSECQWNTVDEFYNNSFWYIGGSICDEDEKVFSIIFFNNNLDGTIIDELSGMKSLETIFLEGNKDLHGTIPSSFGRLSELRRLAIPISSLTGTIPPELFHAKKMQMLMLGINDLSGTVPESIGNLRDLSYLEFTMSSLSQTIPEEIYQLKNLVFLGFAENELTGTISQSIHNLEKLETFYVTDNKLSGTIPSSMKFMEQLEYLIFDNNNFSGTFPNFLSSSSSNLDVLWTHNNSFTGSVSDAFCEMKTYVTADCRNDIFKPKVNCSCCVCFDESPTWGGECADTKISVHIDHKIYDDIIVFRNSDGLVWLLVDQSSEENILLKGPISNWYDGEPSYEACVAYSQYFSLLMLNEPVQDTNFSISWNVDSIYNGTFFSSNQNKDPFVFEILQNATNITNKDLVVVDVLPQNDANFNIQLKCGEADFTLELQTTQRIRYDAAVKISGKKNLRDSSSYQSKALCWILSNELHKETIQSSIHEFIQRYVLTILHLTSKTGLFGTGEYPPLTHECEWQGIKCDIDDTPNIVTSISLSAKNNQIISGTIIQEIGSLAYLETLELRQTEIYGTIPHSFSNLWSLTKLDLSDNKISSTLPATLFRQLNKLQHIDLSNNTLSGFINQDIWSFSRIRLLSLNGNELTGSLPLEGFKHYDLEHLDVSGNELSEIDFSLILEHYNLKFLDISNNFFVGSLLENTFTSLAQLRYFNVSQNDISGTIPSTFPLQANMTHFDLHANKFKGRIPPGIKELQYIQHINVQGNKLTGSLPSELNQLKSLKTLVLSHNELKGSIPFDHVTLQNMEMLHLHRNLLIGKAPDFNTTTSYISDCGFPSDLLEPVECPTCNMCCNFIGKCQTKSPEEFTQVHRTLIFYFVCIVTTIVSMILCRIWKNRIASKPMVSIKNVLHLISDKSAYHFFLYKNPYLWLIGLLTYFFQVLMLFFFVHSTDIKNETSDRKYTKTCPANSLECKDSSDVNKIGVLVFCVVIGIWLLRDVVGSLKLMILSFQEKNPDFFVTSSIVFSVTLLSVWTSFYYVVGIAETNTELLKDVVALLFVIEADERVFQLVEIIRPDWVKRLNTGMDQEFYPDDMKEKFDQQNTGTGEESQQNDEAMKRKPCRKNDLVLQSVITSFPSSFPQLSSSMDRSPSSSKEKKQGDNPETNTEKQTNLREEPNESVEQGSSPDDMEEIPCQDNEKNESCQENAAVNQSSSKLSQYFSALSLSHRDSSIDLEPNTEKPNNV